jgi:hypothetical protein
MSRSVDRVTAPHEREAIIPSYVKNRAEQSGRHAESFEHPDIAAAIANPVA